MPESKDSFRTIVIVIVDGESFTAKVIEAVSRVATNGKRHGVRIETTNREVPKEEWTERDNELIHKQRTAYLWRNMGKYVTEDDVPAFINEFTNYPRPGEG